MPFDPRTAFVTTITKTGPFGKKGDYVTQSGSFDLKGEKISFILPSHSALLLDLANKYFCSTKDFLVFRNFEKTKYHYRPKSPQDFYDFLTQRIVSITLPYDALESFINLEILLAKEHHLARFGKHDPDNIKLGFRGKIFTLMPVLYGLGNEFPPELLETMKEKFDVLNDARNKFVHISPMDIMSKATHKDTIWRFLCSTNFLNYSKICKELIEILCQFKTGKPYWVEQLKI